MSGKLVDSETWTIGPASGPVEKVYWRCPYCGFEVEYTDNSVARDHLAAQHADWAADWEPYMRGER